MIYNKEETKGGRILKASGPRNMQTRAVAADTSEDIKELKAEITKLASSKDITAGGYNQQQVDDMLNEAIEEVSVDLEKKYVKELKELKDKLLHAGDIIQDLTNTLDKRVESLDAKDKVILDLTTKITEISSRPVTVVQGTQEATESKSNRPSIDSVYIDPTEKGKTEKMKSHVKIKEIKDTTGTNTANSINKLKSLMGKSPVKF